jgi:glycosyltransferase involved in cell wall biosynthesis
MNRTAELSAIIVVGSRIDNLTELIAAYDQALARCGAHEIICVLDGAGAAGVYDEIVALRERLQGHLKIVRLTRAFGEATALRCGFDQSRGSVILTLPAYFQVEPLEIGDLVAAARSADMVQAWRHPRRGGRFERIRRSMFHGILRWIIGHEFKDLGCTVRAMHRRVLEELNIYGDQHRFLPVLASNAGFRVVELAAPQSPKDVYRNRYRIREYLHRLLDLFTVFFLVRFTKKPLRFFGTIGSLTFAVGGTVLVIVVAQRLFFGEALADRPALLLSALLVVLGLQLFGLGLIGELIIFTHARALKEYRIAEIIEAERDEAEERIRPLAADST